ncbi:SHOCT domain-containing protein [Micromonospora sp. NBS 11-29]
MTNPIAERLRQLAAIYRDGLISDSEYAEQRERILGEL